MKNMTSLTIVMLVGQIVMVVIVLLALATLFAYRRILDMLLKIRPAALDRQESDESLPAVTLIIPVLNEAGVIAQKIANTRALFYPPEKVLILVVDNGSTDSTAAVARAEGATVLESPSGKISALLRGAEMARTEIIALTDADALLDPLCLKNSLKRLTGDVGAVAAVAVLKDGTTFFARSKKRYQEQDMTLRVLEGKLASTCSLDGKFILTRRSLFLDLPKEAKCDDYEFTLFLVRRGLRSVFAEDAVVFEQHPASLRDELHQIERRTRIGGILTGWRYRDLFLNPRFGIFGLLIFPFRRVFPFLFPFWALYVIVFLWFVSPKLLGAILLMGGVAILAAGKEYALIQLLGVIFSWINILARKNSLGNWEKIHLHSEFKTIPSTAHAPLMARKASIAPSGENGTFNSHVSLQKPRPSPSDH